MLFLSLKHYFQPLILSKSHIDSFSVFYLLFRPASLCLYHIRIIPYFYFSGNKKIQKNTVNKKIANSQLSITYGENKENYKNQFFYLFYSSVLS